MGKDYHIYRAEGQMTRLDDDDGSVAGYGYVHLEDMLELEGEYAILEDEVERLTTERDNYRNGMMEEERLRNIKAGMLESAETEVEVLRADLESAEISIAIRDGDLKDVQAEVERLRPVYEAAIVFSATAVRGPGMTRPVSRLLEACRAALAGGE